MRIRFFACHFTCWTGAGVLTCQCSVPEFVPTMVRFFSPPVEPEPPVPQARRPPSWLKPRVVSPLYDSHHDIHNHYRCCHHICCNYNFAPTLDPRKQRSTTQKERLRPKQVH